MTVESARIEELRRRVDSDPASVSFAILAEEYRRAGRHDDAITACLVGLARHPGYVSARVTLGRALMETGRSEDARVEFERVVRAAPENLAAIRALATLHDRGGDETPRDGGPADVVPALVASSPAPAAPDRNGPEVLAADSTPELSDLEGFLSAIRKTRSDPRNQRPNDCS